MQRETEFYNNSGKRGINMKKNFEDKGLDLFIAIIMIAVVIVTFYPVYYSIIYSFNDANDIANKGFIYFFPRKWTIQNYIIVLSDKMLLNAFLITVARTLCGTVLSVFFTAVVAYPLSKKHLLFRKVYMRIGVATMYFYGGIIPYYLLLKSIHLTNTFWVYIIPALYSFFNAIIFINFFSEIPDAIEESAKIDGASDWCVFWRIVLPLSAPVIATIALFNGVNQWNSWFDAAYFTNGENLQTLQMLLFSIISQAKGAAIAQKILGAGQYNVDIIQSVKYATIVISIVPVALVYPLLQRFFVQGMMVGSVKG